MVLGNDVAKSAFFMAGDFGDPISVFFLTLNVEL
jgi:hypothetical protein